MTIRSDLEAKVVALKAEIATIEDELAKGGNWVDREWTEFETWFQALKARHFAAPTVVNPPVAPPVA